MLLVSWQQSVYVGNQWRQVIDYDESKQPDVKVGDICASQHITLAYHVTPTDFRMSFSKSS